MHTYRFPTQSTVSWGNNCCFLKATYHHTKLFSLFKHSQETYQFTPQLFTLQVCNPANTTTLRVEPSLLRGSCGGEREEQWTRLGVSWQGCLHHDYTDLEVHLPSRAIYSFRMSPVQTANGDTIELALFSNPYKSSSPTERVWLTDCPCSLVWGKRPMAWLFWCCPSALQAALSSSPTSPPQLPALQEHRCCSLVVHCNKTHMGALRYSNPGKQKPPHSTSPLHTTACYRGISTATR